MHSWYTINFSAPSIICLAVFTIYCLAGEYNFSLLLLVVKYSGPTALIRQTSQHSYFYTQMDCVLLQTFYGWLFFCICTTTLSRISWIIFSIMAACIQQLIAFWFVAINIGVQGIYDNSQPSWMERKREAHSWLILLLLHMMYL